MQLQEMSCGTVMQRNAVLLNGQGEQYLDPVIPVALGGVAESPSGAPTHGGAVCGHADVKSHVTTVLGTASVWHATT